MTLMTLEENENIFTLQLFHVEKKLKSKLMRKTQTGLQTQKANR